MDEPTEEEVKKYEDEQKKAKRKNSSRESESSPAELPRLDPVPEEGSPRPDGGDMPVIDVVV